MPESYAAAPERVLLFKLTDWDSNCPEHIQQKIDTDEVEMLLAAKDTQIAELNRQIVRLHQEVAKYCGPTLTGFSCCFEAQMKSQLKR